MPSIPAFARAVIQGISDILAQGHTNREIDQLFQECGLQAGDSGSNKNLRLYNALSYRQQQDGCANGVIAFIQVVMHPASYTANKEKYESKRDDLNKVLGFAGFEIGLDGLLRNIARTATLSEAESRSNLLRKKLLDRNVHGDVLASCRAELLSDGNYFHSVLEVTKGVGQKIRDKSGSTHDGSLLVDEVMMAGKSHPYPVLAINSFRTESERNEQTGFANMVKGLFSAFRNPTAHSPKALWLISEEDALDFMVFASMLHRKLDKSIKTT